MYWDILTCVQYNKVMNTNKNMWNLVKKQLFLKKSFHKLPTLLSFIFSNFALKNHLKLKVGSVCSPLKHQVGAEESLIYFGCQQCWGERVNTYPKADFPQLLHWQSVGKSFYRLREGAPCRNSQWALNSHLETDHRWSDQCHIGCVKYS